MCECVGMGVLRVCGVYVQCKSHFCGSENEGESKFHVWRGGACARVRVCACAFVRVCGRKKLNCGTWRQAWLAPERMCQFDGTFLKLKETKLQTKRSETRQNETK